MLKFPNAELDGNASPSFTLEDCEDFIGLAEQLMDGHHAAVLTTADDEGRPHARWMGTLSFRDFPCFYALTSPHSEKVEQIQGCPDVEWMLSNRDLTLVLNLSGQARILKDAVSIKRAWKAVQDKSQAFFLNCYNEKPGFVVIETVVNRVECTVPRANLKWPTSLDSFQRCLLKPSVLNPTTSLPAGRASNGREPERLQVDEILCQQLEQLSNGAHFQECGNLLAAYRTSFAEYREGDVAMLAVARDVERSLRRMLTKLRLEHYIRLRNGER